MRHLLLGPFDPPLAKNPQNKIFCKNSIKSILRLYVAVTSCKTSEKIDASVFHMCLNSSLWAHFGTFRLKNPRTRLLWNNPAEWLFKLDNTLISCKILEHFYRWFQKINLDKQTKYRVYFIGPSLHVSNN